MITRMTLVVVSLLILSACNDATAENKVKDADETKLLTRAECLAMEIKQDKIDCMKKVLAQSRAELAATQERTAKLKAENDKRRERNEALLKEFEKGVLDEE